MWTKAGNGLWALRFAAKPAAVEDHLFNLEHFGSKAISLNTCPEMAA